MLNDLLRFDVKDCSWCRWVALESQPAFPPEFRSPVLAPTTSRLVLGKARDQLRGGENSGL